MMEYSKDDFIEAMRQVTAFEIAIALIEKEIGIREANSNLLGSYPFRITRETAFEIPGKSAQNSYEKPRVLKHFGTSNFHFFVACRCLDPS